MRDTAEPPARHRGSPKRACRALGVPGRHLVSPSDFMERWTSLSVNEKRSLVRSGQGEPKNSCSSEREFFYPSRQAWYIITTQSCISSPKAYIITRSVYLCRLDDIQLLSKLMICNSCGIDDIQCSALIFRSFYAIIHPRR